MFLQVFDYGSVTPCAVPEAVLAQTPGCEEERIVWAVNQVTELRHGGTGGWGRLTGTAEASVKGLALWGRQLHFTLWWC